MFFKKRVRTDNITRKRQIPVTRGNSAVFSYHASRSARPTSAGLRSTKQSWNNAPEKPVRPRGSSTSWLKRAPVLALAIVAIALVINGLLVSNNPEVITLADKQQQKVFLRSTDTYQQAARQILSSSIFNSNKLTIDTTGIADELSKRFPELEHVSVTLPVAGHQPAIYIQPALPALLVKTADNSVYILDASGRALINAAQTSKVERLGLPVVEDQTGLPVTLGKVVLPSDEVTFIREVVGQLEAKGVSITGVILPKGSSEVDIRIEGVPYIVKFNLHGDARVEAGAYLAVKKHLEREKKTPGSYIDVRVDNRAYYR
jgi:hypothetical protein